MHLFGILFPHINDDARSKSHQNMKSSTQTPEHASSSFLFITRNFFSNNRQNEQMLRDLYLLTAPMFTLHGLDTQRSCKTPTWPKQLTLKCLYNKTNHMHQFPKFIPARNSTYLGQFLCPSSGVYSLYTRHWYMPYRFVDSSRAGPGWNCSSILVLLESYLQNCMTYQCRVYSE